MDELSYLEAKANCWDHGIFCLSICEAAELIARDMWASGDVEATPEPDGRDIEPSDPRLKAALSQTIELFVDRLKAAVQSGKLKAEVVRRDFEERLLPDCTFIAKSDLYEWLAERGYTTDVAFEEWEDTQQEIWSEVMEEVQEMSVIAKEGRSAIRRFLWIRRQHKEGNDDSVSESSEYFPAYLKCLAENAKLKQQIASQQSQDLDREKPLLKRERTNLLNIIGALLELIQSPKKGRDSEAVVIRELIENYSDKPGIAKSTLENKFAAAKSSLRQP